jgi:hypothetical protein
MTTIGFQPKGTSRSKFRRAWFAILRSGILEHLELGRLTFFDLGVYAVILLQADFSTGVWLGSGPRLRATAPAGASLRDIQRSLRALTKIRFLRPFQKHGSRGNYHILIDKYEVRSHGLEPALTRMRLNAWKSISYDDLRYEVCAEDVGEPAPYQYKDLKTLRLGVGFESERPLGVACNVERKTNPENPSPKNQKPQNYRRVDRYGMTLANQGEPSDE